MVGGTGVGYAPGCLLQTGITGEMLQAGHAELSPQTLFILPLELHLASATFTGSGDACFGAISTIKSVITGGAPFYTLTIAGYPLSPVTQLYIRE